MCNTFYYQIVTLKSPVCYCQSLIALSLHSIHLHTDLLETHYSALGQSTQTHRSITIYIYDYLSFFLICSSEKKPYHVIFNLLMCPQMSTFNRWLCDKRHPVTIILCIFLLPGTSWVLNLSIYKYFIAERFQS